MTNSSPEPLNRGQRTYAGLSGDERDAQRRRQFLDAGLEIFGTTGYANATVRGVCRAAGLTDRYFYRHFGNLEGLLIAVYERCMASVKENTLREFSDSSQENIDERIRQGLSALMDEMEDPRVARVCYIEPEGVSDDVEALYNRYIVDFADILTGIIRQTLSQWQPSEDESRMLGLALIGATRQSMAHWVLSGFAFDREVILDSLCTVFIGVIHQLQQD